jgi:hypothetical protein
MITEECSCGAKISIPSESPAYVDKWAAIVKAISEWREGHRHEFAPVEPASLESPLIHESNSSHERLGEYMSTENDIPFGFTRNEAR